jgi:hypothetical protein
MTGKTLWMAVAIEIRANVPFDFKVGNQTVPAGEYLITQDAARGSVRILSTGDGVSLAVLRHPVSGNRTGASTDGAQMPVSRSEKEQMVRYAPGKTTLVAAAAAHLPSQSWNASSTVWPR